MKYIYIVFCFIVLFGCSRPRNKDIKSEGKEENQSSLAVELSNNTEYEESANSGNLRIFIENSGSMDGFVNGPTEFKNIVFRYLSDISYGGLFENTYGYYVNSKLISIKKPISDIILSLSPLSFRQMGGSRKDTDIADLIQLILNEIDKRDVAMLISDFIFSPGTKYCNTADAYLQQQQNIINNEISKRIQSDSEFAVVVLRFTSLFDGIHYNKCNVREIIKSDRPFYIWLMGGREKLKEMIQPAVLDINNNMIKLTDIYSNEQVQGKLDYQFKYDNKGLFQLDRHASGSLVNCKIDPRTGIFAFKIKVNFKHFLVDNNYLMNLSNYDVSNSIYSVAEITPLSGDDKYTHEILIKSDKVVPVNLTIYLKKNLPDWVTNKNDMSGSNLISDSAMDKTYGLTSQINALEDSFNKQNNNYAELTISIK